MVSAQHHERSEHASNLQQGGAQGKRPASVLAPPTRGPHTQPERATHTQPTQQRARGGPPRTVVSQMSAKVKSLVSGKRCRRRSSLALRPAWQRQLLGERATIAATLLLRPRVKRRSPARGQIGCRAHDKLASKMKSRCARLAARKQSQRDRRRGGRRGGHGDRRHAEAWGARQTQHLLAKNLRHPPATTPFCLIIILTHIGSARQCGSQSRSSPARAYHVRDTSCGTARHTCQGGSVREMRDRGRVGTQHSA